MSNHTNLPEVVRLAEVMHAEKCDCGSSSEQDKRQAEAILAAIPNPPSSDEKETNE